MRNKYAIAVCEGKQFYGHKKFIYNLDKEGELEIYSYILCHNLADLRSWLVWYRRHYPQDAFIQVGQYTKEFFW